MSAFHKSKSGTVIALATLAGCDMIPGTNAFVEEKAKSAVAQVLVDPASAMFRAVSLHGQTVCGEVNGKNKMGAYVGYARFVVDTRTMHPLLDQGFEYADLASARELCSNSASVGGASFSASSCGRVADLEAKEMLQSSFDKLWSADCGRRIVRQVFQPPLSPDDTPDVNVVHQNLVTASLPDESSMNVDENIMTTDMNATDGDLQNEILPTDEEGPDE